MVYYSRLLDVNTVGVDGHLRKATKEEAKYILGVVAEEVLSYDRVELCSVNWFTDSCIVECFDGISCKQLYATKDYDGRWSTELHGML